MPTSRLRLVRARILTRILSARRHVTMPQVHTTPLPTARAASGQRPRALNHGRCHRSRSRSYHLNRHQTRHTSRSHMRPPLPLLTWVQLAISSRHVLGNLRPQRRAHSPTPSPVCVRQACQTSVRSPPARRRARHHGEAVVAPKVAAHPVRCLATCRPQRRQTRVRLPAAHCTQPSRCEPPACHSAPPRVSPQAGRSLHPRCSAQLLSE